jgi:hypothetical protein
MKHGDSNHRYRLEGVEFLNPHPTENSEKTLEAPSCKPTELAVEPLCGPIALRQIKPCKLQTVTFSV